MDTSGIWMRPEGNRRKGNKGRHGRELRSKRWEKDWRTGWAACHPKQRAPFGDPKFDMAFSKATGRCVPQRLERVGSSCSQSRGSESIKLLQPRSAEPVHRNGWSGLGQTLTVFQGIRSPAHLSRSTRNSYVIQ
uniref:Uncharacterized protein n=1 Tax=Oryza brachyantha TaxID=4533 RepID=J3MBZ9_ORYBR